MTLPLYIIAVALVVMAATTLKKKHEENKLLKLEIERTQLEIQVLKNQKTI